MQTAPCRYPTGMCLILLTLMSRHTSTMTISLPEDLKQFVKKRSLTAHYGTPSDYIRGLIREDLKRLAEERLEQELVKGLLHHPLPGIGIVPLLILGDMLARHEENHLVVFHHFQFLTSIKTETFESLGRKGDLMPRADLDARHGWSPVRFYG